MEVYVFKHLHAGSENVLGGVKMLGCYSSLASIKIAREKYRNLCGFSTYPHGFYSRKYTVYGNAKNGSSCVYIAEAYIHDEMYEFEHDEILGVFWRDADAKRCLSNFRRENADIDRYSGFILELTASRYLIDKMEWIDGFN